MILIYIELTCKQMYPQPERSIVRGQAFSMENFMSRMKHLFTGAGTESMLPLCFWIELEWGLNQDASPLIHSSLWNWTWVKNAWQHIWKNSTRLPLPEQVLQYTFYFGIDIKLWTCLPALTLYRQAMLTGMAFPILQKSIHGMIHLSLLLVDGPKSCVNQLGTGSCLQDK